MNESAYTCTLNQPLNSLPPSRDLTLVDDEPKKVKRYQHIRRPKYRQFHITQDYLGFKPRRKSPQNEDETRF